MWKVKVPPGGVGDRSQRMTGRVGHSSHFRRHRSPERKAAPPLHCKGGVGGSLLEGTGIKKAG